MTGELQQRLKQLSSPFATGGGGNNFERHVQAVFMLSLLVDGFSPVINAPVKVLHFQAKHLGYNTDDLVVISGIQTRGKKLLCQIKNDIRITKTDQTFQEVITAAWNDYISDQFDRDIDRIALVTSVIAKPSLGSLIVIHEQAIRSINAEDFLQRIGQSNFISSDTRHKFEVLKHCLCKAKGNELSEEEIYGFSQAFIPVVFDGNYEGSVHEALCQSLIRCKSDSDPRKVWNMLTFYAGQYNQSAASITMANIASEIKELFGFKTEGIKRERFIPSEFWAWFALIGAWNENNTEDKRAIECITGRSYSEFLAFARERLNAGDQYISLTDGIWSISYRREIFLLVKDSLFDDAILNAFNTASQIAVESSKRFENADDVDFFRPASGWFSNSDSFRKGLCEGLCLMANNSPPKNSSTGLVERQAFILVRDLLSKSSWKTLAGLEGLTSLFAELSPKAFLQGLESLYVKRGSDLQKLFPKKNRAFNNDNHLVHILWSLEKLAWIPEYYGRCVRCFSMLELSGYEKTNHRNIPFNSLITILNAFKPQTYASLQQMKNAILAIQRDSQDLCWAVIKALLPESSFVLVETPKPKYINISSCEREFSEDELKELLKYYIDTAVQMSYESTDRIAVLSKHIDYMSNDMISTYMQQIISAAANWTDEMKYPVWDSLNDLRVRVIIENKGTEPDSLLFQLLSQAIKASMPLDKWYQYLHLYTDNLDEYYLEEYSSSNIVLGFEERDVARSEAILDLYNSYGIDKVILFGDSIKNQLDVGQKLGASLNCSQIGEVLHRYSEAQNSQFYPAVINAFIAAHGVQSLFEIGLEDYDESFRAKVLCSAPFNPETFSVLDQLLSDKTLYWKNVPVLWFSPKWENKTVEAMIHELATVGRFDAIINSLGHYIERISISEELLKSIMYNAASEIKLDRLDSHAACRIINQLQASATPDIELLSAIEYAFLPFMTASSGTRPKALYYKLSNDSDFFCDLMELTFKPHHAEHPDHELSVGVQQRLYQLIFNYCVVPGVDWNGDFSPMAFREWVSSSIKWAEETDRLAVVQQTIGNGLSHAKIVDGLPDDEIMKVLNEPQNLDMRKGYQIGILNQRGAFWVDPEAKPELELARRYDGYANAAEDRGFSRFAETLKDISDSYFREAEMIIKESAMEDDK